MRGQVFLKVSNSRFPRAAAMPVDLLQITHKIVQRTTICSILIIISIDLSQKIDLRQGESKKVYTFGGLSNKKHGSDLWERYSKLES